MNKVARLELKCLALGLGNYTKAIEYSSQLSDLALEQLSEIKQLNQMLLELEIGIDRVLNELQYSLATLTEFFDPWDSQTARIQMAIDEITDFLTSHRYRKQPRN